MSAVWFVVVDVCLVLYMRDSVLLFFNVFFKVKCVIDWQAQGVAVGKNRQQKGQSIVWPPNAFFKKQEDSSTNQDVDETSALKPDQQQDTTT